MWHAQTRLRTKPHLEGSTKAVPIVWLLATGSYSASNARGERVACFGDISQSAMTRELAVTFRNEIGRKLQECEQADKDFKASLLVKLEKTRLCGVAIEAAKADLRRHEFSELVDQLGLSGGAIKSFLAFARKHSAPIESSNVREAMHAAFDAATATGLLPYPVGHGPQKLHAPNFFSRLELIVQNIAVEWKKFTNRCPVNHWRDEQKEQLCESLKPILSIHREVALSLRNGK